MEFNARKWYVWEMGKSAMGASWKNKLGQKIISINKKRKVWEW